MVERKHKHVVETAITLLIAAGLPAEFWYYACAHLVLLINMMAFKSLALESSYKRLYTKQPNLKSIRIFGITVYPWLRPYNNNKLQPRSERCIFLGYSMGYKGVICYNPKTRKCIVSRNVLFGEMVYPYIQDSQHNISQQPMDSFTSSHMVRLVVPVPIPTQVLHHENAANQNGHLHSAYSLSQSRNISLQDEGSSNISINPNASTSIENQDISS